MNREVLDIDLLFFEGCPSYRQTWEDLLEVIVGLKIQARIKPVMVDSPKKAEDLQFGGSPSVRINAVDLEGYQGSGTMACRVYQENGGNGWPSKALLERRLKEALSTQ